MRRKNRGTPSGERARSDEAKDGKTEDDKAREDKSKGKRPIEEPDESAAPRAAHSTPG